MHVRVYSITYLIQVNKKGVISFENLQIVSTPSPLHFSFLQMIAPFWADVDTRGTGNVFYRQTTDPNLLARATDEIKSAFPTSSNTTIRNLLIVTWDTVGYYSQHTDKVCKMYLYIYTYISHVAT